MSVEIFVVMALALGGGGLVKGATGMGLPLVALPILAAFLGVPHAVALMCIPGLFTNLWQVWRLRADMAAADFLPWMVMGGAVGIAIGTWLITSVPERGLSFALAVIVLAYASVRLFKPEFAISAALGRKLAPGLGVGAGVLQGATGIGSPLSVTFIHAMRLPRRAHVFAVSAMFLAFTLIQIPALAIAGVLTGRIALEGAVAIIPALAAMPAGMWLAERFSQKTFDWLILALLAAAALRLMATSLGA